MSTAISLVIGFFIGKYVEKHNSAKDWNEEEDKAVNFIRGIKRKFSEVSKKIKE